MAGKVVRNADEAAKILKELWETPQMISLHFEFDASVDEMPRVRYTIERFAFKVEEKRRCGMRVDILGTEYTVEVKKYTDDEAFERSGIDGYCDSWSKKIVVCDMTTFPNFENEPRETREAAQKETLRHEIVHAFFSESGLESSAIRYSDRAWSKNEEMVDWIAIQGPKIYKAWERAGAL